MIANVALLKALPTVSACWALLYYGWHFHHACNQNRLLTVNSEAWCIRNVACSVHVLQTMLRFCCMSVYPKVKNCDFVLSIKAYICTQFYRMLAVKVT